MQRTARKPLARIIPGARMPSLGSGTNVHIPQRVPDWARDDRPDRHRFLHSRNEPQQPLEQSDTQHGSGVAGNDRGWLRGRATLLAPRLDQKYRHCRVKLRCLGTTNGQRRDAPVNIAKSHAKNQCVSPLRCRAGLCTGGFRPRLGVAPLRAVSSPVSSGPGCRALIEARWLAHAGPCHLRPAAWSLKLRTPSSGCEVWKTFWEKLEKLIPWFLFWKQYVGNLAPNYLEISTLPVKKVILCVRAPVSTFIAAARALRVQFIARISALCRSARRRSAPLTAIIGDTRGVECVVSGRFGSQRRANR